MSVSNTTKRVKEIRRKTRCKFSSEEKSASFWKDCAASARLPNCVAVKASTIICITAGAKTFSKPASGAWPELTPRELARHLTDRHEYFISESSVYRSLKAHDLVTSPQFMVMSAADAFQHPTRRVHELWQTDFTCFREVGRGWYFLSAVLDDYSRYIISWRLTTTMAASDVTDTLGDALKATGLSEARVHHKPRLLSDNGPCYISKELREWLQDREMEHTRGAPYHPMTQGKIERYHRSMIKSRTLTQRKAQNLRLAG